MRKNISAKEVKYIYPKQAKIAYWLDKFCIKWEIYENNNNENSIFLKGKWRLWVKTVLFIPVVITILIHSLWDGGLKSGFNRIHNFWNIPTLWEQKDFYTNSTYAKMKKVLDS